MEIVNEIWSHYIYPFLTLLGMVILYFTSKNILPSYFNEKGKNLATREDITEITKLVEQVKVSFTKETEHLKANLQFLTNINIGLAAEERNAIVEFNIKYFKWFNLLTDSSLKDVNQYDNVELDKYLVHKGELYRDLKDSETKFGLFIENHELISAMHTLKSMTLKLMDEHPDKCVFALKNNNLEMQHIKNTTPSAQQTEKLKPLFQQREQIGGEFRSQIVANYENVLPLAKEFQKLCRNHIYKLISGTDS